MAGKRKPQPEESPEGAPEWMVTFSDCMTLLLTFFVLLMSFATFDDKKLEQLGESFAEALPAIGMFNLCSEEALYEKKDSPDSRRQKQGTETPNLSRTLTSNFMQEKKPLDFRNLKVFTVPSGQFFWGRGTAISQSGREVLQALAKFLQSTPGRVVISENGPDGKIELGLERCLAVLEYFTKEQGLSPDRFCISASSTMRTAPTQRQLEITLLERSIYE
jgi:chemotaxis protein MotB